MTSRPTNPTIAQIIEVCQPEEIRGRASSEHWLNDVYLRRLSPYQTRLLLKTGVSANGVTWMMIVAGAGAGLVLIIPGLIAGLISLLLGQLQMLLDCSDGEIARWKQQFSPAGIFLDKVGHYTAEGIIPIALGIRAAGGLNQLGLDSLGYLTVGLAISALLIYNKALNDMVHVSRAFNGLDRLSEAPSVSAPRGGVLSMIRKFARIIPFHRIFHSVEMSALAALAAVVDYLAGSLVGTQSLVIAMLISACVTVPGHLVAILSSSRLR